MGPPAYTASPCTGSALFSNTRAPPPPPRLLIRWGPGPPSAVGRHGGRLAPSQERRRPAPSQERRGHAPSQERRRPAPSQERRRPSESSSQSHQLQERKRHWKAGEFPGTAADGGGGGGRRAAIGNRHSKAGEFPGTDGGRPAPAPPQGKRHWKAGEFPGAAAAPGSGTPRTPLKNVKKRLDARADAKAWACTVTEALADRVSSKNWQEALQVKHHRRSLMIPACLHCSTVCKNP